MWKSSSASWPSPDGALPPTGAVTRGRGGRLARHVAGMRTTTPRSPVAGRRAGAEWLHWASTAAGERSRPRRPWPSATGSSPPLAAPEAAATADDPCSPRPRTRAEPAQRQMLRLGVRREPRGVGRQKRKGRLRIVAVFGQIEVDAADQVPRRVAALQELLHAAFGLRQFDAEGGVQSLPEAAEDLPSDLRATHPVPKALNPPPEDWSAPFARLAAECRLELSAGEAFGVLEEFYSAL